MTNEGLQKLMNCLKYARIHMICSKFFISKDATLKNKELHASSIKHTTATQRPTNMTTSMMMTVTLMMLIMMMVSFKFCLNKDFFNYKYFVTIFYLINKIRYTKYTKKWHKFLILFCYY